jgi:hypothetical protein
MRKIAGILFAVLVVSLVLLPGPVFAGDLGSTCQFDTVKWEANKDSCFLYLDNWGKTPITAMSRLAGGAYPSILTGCVLSPNPGSCYGMCASCNDQAGNSAGCTDPKVCKSSVECPGTNDCAIPPAGTTDCNAKAIVGYAHCNKCWGVSLAFANKGWAGNTLGDLPRINNSHPDHFGTSDRNSAGKGGDWGITGCPHAECSSDIWCVQCNLDKDAACRQ